MNVVVVGSGTYTSCYATETSSQQWDVVWSGITPSYGCTFRNIVITTKIGRTFTYTTTSGTQHFGGYNNEPISATITFDGTPIKSFKLWTYVSSEAAAAEGATTSPASETMRFVQGKTYVVPISATPETYGYRFTGWRVYSGTAVIADSGSASTTVTMTIPDSAIDFSDVKLYADYIGTSEVSIEVIQNNNGVITPGYAAGIPPLSESFEFFPSLHTTFSEFRVWKKDHSKSQHYYSNPALVTVQDNSELEVLPIFDVPIEIVVEPDPSYGIITLSIDERSGDVWPMFVEGDRGKGFGWWRSIAINDRVIRITCTDNPNNPPGVTYLGLNIPGESTFPTADLFDLYDCVERKWHLSEQRYISSDRTARCYTRSSYAPEQWNPPRMKFYGARIVFSYSSPATGGHILYGSNNSILHGTSGGILYGLNG